MQTSGSDSEIVTHPSRAGEAEPVRLDVQAWSEALHRFCEVTRLAASLYDAKGQRIAGPFHCTGLGALLDGAGFFEPGAPGHETERTMARSVLADPRGKSIRFGNALRVDALPLVLGGKTVGAIVFGWAFDHFSDPVECERLGRLVGIPGHRVWSQARLERPTSAANFEVDAALLETLVRAILRQVEAINRLRELARVREEFLAGVSHELRTPLQSIQLRVEQLLRTRLDDPDNVRRLLEAVRRSVEAETRLVEDLIDSARTTTGTLRLDLRPLRLSAVVREALEASEPSAAAKGVDLRVTLPPASGVELLGDVARLRQVLWNLVSNAIKFTPTGGSVQVAVKELPREVELRVTDTGAGIDAALLARLFDPFTQGEASQRRHGGLGLGLAISRHIVELHGGRIEAQSDGPGSGATFVIHLPRPNTLEGAAQTPANS